MNDTAKEVEVKGPLTGRTLTVEGGKVTPKSAKKEGKVVNFPKKDGAKASDKAEAAPKAQKKGKEKAEKKAAPAKAKKSKRGYPADAKIRLIGKENPHREKSGDHKKWKALSDLSPRTVEAALENGVDTGYLRLLVKRELIEVEA